ncbi:copper transporter [Flaviflexus huanghaiensis]|uniref:copper transporter n=1 Tax=Flaviflexus huanghaiensis TaxID=1111473 RepID=UPI0015FE37C7|nr:copper transporter [Flaviflexus huanghaiensis]
MVDFRYHLVSLIAVFMALAIGIVLGAGPLQNSIGSALNDQVESLRQSRDDARIVAQDAESRSAAYREGLESLAPDMVASTLDGQTVVVVTLPGTEDSVRETQVATLTAAGATVTGTVALTENMFSAERAAYRNALAGQLGSYVEPADSPLGTLARGLDYIVTTAASDAGAATLAELYQSEDTALIEVTDTLTGPATAILVIGPAEEEVVEETEPPDDTNMANTIEVLSSLKTPMVLTAKGGEGTLLEAIRDGGLPISTVDSPEDATALINIPFALTQELTGSTVNWGIAPSADRVLGTSAPIELAGPAPGDGTSQEGDGTGGEDPTDGADQTAVP